MLSHLAARRSLLWLPKTSLYVYLLIPITMNQLSFTFDNNYEIHFKNEGENLMVNATEMARPFEKKVENFTRMDSTKSFIDECLKNANSRFLRIESEYELIRSVQKSGTWMHRVLALKFAAWLSPAFELWVYSTIDEILFGHYREMEKNLRVSADRQDKIEELKHDLRRHEQFLELEELMAQERRAAYQRGKFNKNQLSLFRTN